MPRRIGPKISPPPRHFIRQWREARDMTQEQLAEAIDSSESTISRLENGCKGYTQGTLEAIAAALDASVIALLSIDPSESGQDDIYRIVQDMSRREREQAIRLLRAMRPFAA